MLAGSLLYSPRGHAQTPAWQLALLAPSVGGGSADIRVVEPLANGDFYLAGSFYGSVQLGNLTLTSTGSVDGFVARYQPSTNTVVWAQQLTGPQNEHFGQLVVRGFTIYVTGSFFGDYMRVGGQILVNSGPVTGYSCDSFVLKLTDTGTQASLGWVYQLRGAGSEQVQAVADDGALLYVGGEFDSPTLDLGSSSLPLTPPLPGGSPAPDGFVLALRDTGTSADVQWTLAVGSASLATVKALAVYGSTLYVGGEHLSVSGSPTRFDGIGLPAAPTLTGFVGKLALAGSQRTSVWVQELPNSTSVELNSLAATSTGVYACGSFRGPSLTIGPSLLTGIYSTEAYVARLLDNGSQAQWAWGRSMGGFDYDRATTVLTDGQGAYVVGYFNSPTLTLGGNTLVNPLPLPRLTYDVFVTYLTAAGSFGAAQQVGGPGSAYLSTLALAAGQLYVAGSFSGVATFGSQSLTALNGTSTAFVATLPTVLLGQARAATLPSLALLPNPAHGRAELRLPAGTGVTPFGITMLDALGRVVQRREVAAAASGQTIGLNLAGLAPGVYAVRVQQGAAQAVQKLVAE